MDWTTFFNVSGVIGTIIGIVSFILYIKDKRIKEPCWNVARYPLIQENISRTKGLEIKYYDEKIENLMIDSFIFWNNGADTIHKQDISTANHIRIIGDKETRILNAYISKVVNTSNQIGIDLSEDKSSIYIHFDYLDKGQGAAIQVMHTGNISNKLSIVGDIKGAKGLQQRKRVIRRKTALFSAIYIGLCAIGLDCIVLYGLYKEGFSFTPSSIIGAFFIFIMASIFHALPILEFKSRVIDAYPIELSSSR